MKVLYFAWGRERGGRAEASPDAAIAGAREIAFSPPMTGG